MTTLLDMYQTSRFELDRMTEHDLLEVVEIEEACGLSRWGWEGYHAELLEEKSALMIVARLQAEGRAGGSSGRIVGFISARRAADELHINNVAVRREHRRRGVGGALLAAVLRQGKERGARKALLEVRAGNGPAQLLYARHGFAEVARRANYYSQPTEDALVMGLSLPT